MSVGSAVTARVAGNTSEIPFWVLEHYMELHITSERSRRRMFISELPGVPESKRGRDKPNRGGLLTSIRSCRGTGNLNWNGGIQIDGGGAICLP
jgi:hypothetical protein